MRPFANMLKYFYKVNKKSRSRLGLGWDVKLIAYPDKTINEYGNVTLGTPSEHSIQAVFVPFALLRFGRVFGSSLIREGRGEYFRGQNMLFVDEKWLQQNSIVIDTQLDRIEVDGDQYKLTRYAEFKHYHMVGVYLCQRVAETYEE